MRDDDDWGDEQETVRARWDDLTSVPYVCAACGARNSTLLDLTGGLHQAYTEDCAVCCRPNLLRIDVEPETLMVSLTNELEYE